ncbi:MAG: hypothetical protein KDA80_04300 [Planctomycetaceae bacterium]|nr:hypothetical protein [Planctomycetaceae bacterium]
MRSLSALSSIVFHSPEWTAVLITVLILFAALTIVSTLFSSKGTLPWRMGLASVKIAAGALLTICLVDPQWASQRMKPGENIIVMLADQSSSMSIKDSPDASQSRGEIFQKELADLESEWQTRLAQDFDVRRYRFDTSLAQTSDYKMMDFTGRSSNLWHSLKTLADRYHAPRNDRDPEHRLAGVLLFSDGNLTDEPESSEIPIGVPIYPVAIDQQHAAGDLSIGNVSVAETNFEDSPITIGADIRRTRDLSGPVTVVLEPVDGTEESERQTKTIPLSNVVQNIRFQVKPLKTGPIFYRLRAFFEGQEDLLDTPDKIEEATTVNNEQFAVANRDAQPHRLLYVGGRPNWEHKFLSRAMEDDRLLQLVSLVRIARKEAKFDFRGRVGDDNNSLFRGFNDGADDGTENYDEPVLIRLNTRDELELSQGFPQTKAELYQYDALILDDVEAAFLTRDQMSLVDKYVSERGGGLVMLGGRDSFHHGGWDKTPIGDAIPVYIDRPGVPNPEEMFAWELTREGWLEDWMRLRETEGPERTRIAEMPPFAIASPVGGVKPGARILAALNDGTGRTLPALVTQQYGRGRTAALLLGDFWKWSLKQEDKTEEDPGKFWRQFIRWLLADVPRRTEVTTESFHLGGVPATQIKVRVRDQEFQPFEGIGVNVAVQQPDGQVIELDAQPSLEEAGLFEAVHVSRQNGMYTATVSTPGDERTPAETLKVGWVSSPSAQEFERTAWDRDTLERLARETGGEVVAIDELNTFVSSLPTRKLPVMETQTSPLWHRPWLLGAVILLLAVEWGLRRMRGMA